MAERDVTNPSAEGDQTRCGFVALIGAPNAGKSTLINRLVGSKVSIVTHKVQTTRSIIRGIVMAGETQLVLVDTPGIFVPKRRLDRAMVTTAWGGAKDADLVGLLIDARKGIDEQAEAILNGLSDVRQTKFLIVNKIDLVPREALLEISKAANDQVAFDRTFMVSALSGDGVDDLIPYMAENSPAGPWMYPLDQLSDLPLRQLASEITREKIFLRLHEELPYSSTVETERWKEQKDGSARIEQVVFVERDTHKKILIGKNGQTIKAISQAAREELADLLGHPVHLFLFVKVRRKWGDDPERYREMGLEFPS